MTVDWFTLLCFLKKLLWFGGGLGFAWAYFELLGLVELALGF